MLQRGRPRPWRWSAAAELLLRLERWAPATVRLAPCETPRASPWRVRASTGRNAHGGCCRLVCGELSRGASTGRRWRTSLHNANTRTKGRRVACERLRDRAPGRRGRAHAPSAIRCLRTRRRSGNTRRCTPPISPDAHSHRRPHSHRGISALSIAGRPGRGVADHRVGDSPRARRVPVSPRLSSVERREPVAGLRCDRSPATVR